MKVKRFHISGYAKSLHLVWVPAKSPYFLGYYTSKHACCLSFFIARMLTAPNEPGHIGHLFEADKTYWEARASLSLSRKRKNRHLSGWTDAVNSSFTLEKDVQDSLGNIKL
ncbi:hypothetical protein [Paenibacillus ihbetae]|uniref:hypothetical protein n=1 Tax=Paenibacillus ihbetae TaxID=1870820 RepID=UPI000F746B96|nr:hypothetical protein [Paenibacillus ihbetae]